MLVPMMSACLQARHIDYYVFPRSSSPYFYVNRSTVFGLYLRRLRRNLVVLHVVSTTINSSTETLFRILSPMQHSWYYLCLSYGDWTSLGRRRLASVVSSFLVFCESSRGPRYDETRVLLSLLITKISIVCVSITRFTFVIKLDLKSPDITWNFVNSQIWSGVESHIGITCGKLIHPSSQPFGKNPVMMSLNHHVFKACLPSLRPILNLVLFGSIDRNHRRGHDTLPPSAPGSRKQSSWNPRMYIRNSGAANVSKLGSVTRTTVEEGEHGFIRLSDRGTDDTDSDARKLRNVRSQNGDIHVRTDIYLATDKEVAWCHGRERLGCMKIASVRNRRILQRYHKSYNVMYAWWCLLVMVYSACTMDVKKLRDLRSRFGLDYRIHWHWKTSIKENSLVASVGPSRIGTSAIVAIVALCVIFKSISRSLNVLLYSHETITSMYESLELYRIHSSIKFNVTLNMSDSKVLLHNQESIISLLRRKSRLLDIAEYIAVHGVYDSGS